MMMKWINAEDQGRIVFYRITDTLFPEERANPKTKIKNSKATGRIENMKVLNSLKKRKLLLCRVHFLELQAAQNAENVQAERCSEIFWEEHRMLRTRTNKH